MRAFLFCLLRSVVRGSCSQYWCCSLLCLSSGFIQPRFCFPLCNSPTYQTDWAQLCARPSVLPFLLLCRGCRNYLQPPSDSRPNSVYDGDPCAVLRSAGRGFGSSVGLDPFSGGSGLFQHLGFLVAAADEKGCCLSAKPLRTPNASLPAFLEHLRYRWSW